MKFLDVVEAHGRRLVFLVNAGIATSPDDNKTGIAEWHRVWVQRRIVDIVRARSENRVRWIGRFHLVKFQRRPAREKQRRRRIGRPRLAFSPGGAEHSLKLEGVHITVLNEFRTVRRQRIRRIIAGPRATGVGFRRAVRRHAKTREIKFPSVIHRASQVPLNECVFECGPSQEKESRDDRDRHRELCSGEGRREI